MMFQDGALFERLTVKSISLCAIEIAMHSLAAERFLIEGQGLLDRAIRIADTTVSQKPTF